MLIATQGSNQLYFTDNEDCIAVQNNSVVLFRGKKQYIMGVYPTMERAQSALKDALKGYKDNGILEFPKG